MIFLGFTCSLTTGEIAVDVSIDNKLIATVPATYCSFNIDGVSLHDSFNWSDPNFFKVTKVWTASGPTHLRIGGTFGDYVAYGVTSIVCGCQLTVRYRMMSRVPSPMQRVATS